MSTKACMFGNEWFLLDNDDDDSNNNNNYYYDDEMLAEDAEAAKHDFQRSCLLDGQAWQSEDSAIDIAEQHGAICGDGASVSGEHTSYTGHKRAIVPCGEHKPSPTNNNSGGGGDAGGGRRRHTEKFVFEPFSVQMMRKCKLPPYFRDKVDWRPGVGILLGNFINNIAHFSRDITWLYKIFSQRWHELIAAAFETDVRAIDNKIKKLHIDSI